MTLSDIELVADYVHGQVFLHCMPCGATFMLYDSPLTVDRVVCYAEFHVPHCPGEMDDG